MSLHPMLLRQLERAGWSNEGALLSPKMWNDVLQRVSRAYTEADQERYLLSRSQDLASREIEEVYLRLSEAQRIAGLGNWSFNLVDDTGQWSDGCIQIFGLACSSLTPRYSSFLQCIHPVDREKFITDLNRALGQGDNFEIEFRVIAENNAIRWVLANVQPIPGLQGPPAQIRGTFIGYYRS